MESLVSCKIGLLNVLTCSKNQFFNLLKDKERNYPSTPICISFLNPHVYNSIKKHSEIKKYLEFCKFVALDGIGVSLPAILWNKKFFHRLPMDNLFDECIRNGKIKGRALLIGLSESEIALSSRNLSEVSEDIIIVRQVDRFKPMDEYEMLFQNFQDIDFVIVGMGTPYSEKVLLKALTICRKAICWHVGGGTLKNWAGTKKRTPKVISFLGLGWVHRILFEPETRSRYFLGFPKYVWYLLKDSFFD
jgi:N-acetylglucosaminyldiphosphoundecaprenol N-acetyl-beta-D-mannosaminyltransferase